MRYEAIAKYTWPGQLRRKNPGAPLRVIRQILATGLLGTRPERTKVRTVRGSDRGQDSYRTHHAILLLSSIAVRMNASAFSATFGFERLRTLALACNILERASNYETHRSILHSL